MKINTNIKYPQTKSLCRVTIIIFALFILLPVICHSQDLYNPEQSRKYAEYLFTSRQHILAAEEYERLIYFDKNNVDFKYRLIKSYRLSGNLNSGINRLYSLYGDSIYTMPQSLATEFIKMQLLQDSLSVSANYLRLNRTFSPESRATYQSCNLLLEGDYKGASQNIQQAAQNNIFLPENIVSLTDRASKIKFKSPYIAAGFSAIIPGTGKFYTKNWSDGIFSLLFVASNAWQAYRGFNRDGIKSGYGWVFSGLTASFYIGNIFGSVKAAKRYNIVKKNEIENQVFEFVRSDSF